MYKNFFKRIIDLVLSFSAILILSPVFILIYIILLVTDKENPFFFQARPGKDKCTIMIIKFKSMNNKKDAEGNLLPDMQRMTKTGRFLRKFSLDELPQLFNVIKGDMSLVGPRPLLFKYLPLFNEEQNRRHEVRPGITGWAQVNGRNSISWTEKFKYDVYYVENVSFFLDVKILFLTVIKVFKSSNVNQSENRPMLPFNGRN